MTSVRSKRIPRKHVKEHRLYPFKEEILRLRKEYHTYGWIAKQLGCDANTLRRFLQALERDEGIPYDPYAVYGFRKGLSARSEESQTTK